MEPPRFQWTALLPGLTCAGTSTHIDAAGDAIGDAAADTVRSLATWCLQFTPRVAIVEAVNVVMETEASVRLFGGTTARRGGSGRDEVEGHVCVLA